MNNPFVITLVSKGTPRHQRFILGNKILTWDGTDWNLDENEGLLFGSEHDARAVCEAIEDFSSKPSYRFSCPVQIEVRCDSPPDVDELRLWMSRNARLYVHDSPSSADVDHDGLALMKVDFFKLEVQK